MAGQANDNDLLVVLCRNCHGKATAEQEDVGALEAGRRASCVEAMKMALVSLGTSFSLLAAACYQWSAQLAQMIGVLDEQVPEWRVLPGMP